MKLKIVNTLVLLIGTVSISEVYAACTPERGFKSQDVSMAVGRVVVKPSDAVGSVLRKSVTQYIVPIFLASAYDYIVKPKELQASQAIILIAENLNEVDHTHWLMAILSSKL